MMASLPRRTVTKRYALNLQVLFHGQTSRRCKQQTSRNQTAALKCIWVIDCRSVLGEKMLPACDKESHLTSHQASVLLFKTINQLTDKYEIQILFTATSTVSSNGHFQLLKPKQISVFLQRHWLSREQESNDCSVEEDVREAVNHAWGPTNPTDNAFCKWNPKWFH